MKSSRAKPASGPSAMVASLAASNAPAIPEKGAPFFCDFFLPVFAFPPVSALLAMVLSFALLRRITRPGHLVKYSSQCEQLQTSISELETIRDVS